ncbi:MAG: Crp/Fnr family transcriptional regulator [Anaerolineae bacterium]|jgi:CRP-like cAMP-binding protein
MNNSIDRNVTTIFNRLVEQNQDVGESLTVRAFSAGEVVAQSEEMAHSLFLVASGRVQLYRLTEDDRRFVVATLGPGSLLGEDSLLGGEGPNTYAVALEPCTLWIMPRKKAIEISSTDALFGFGLMQAMGHRLMAAENRLEQMAYSTIAARLAGLLLELAGDTSDNVVHATHQELADMLGTWRETISKTLQDFRRRGLVASGRRQLTLLDKDGLALEAGGL